MSLGMHAEQALFACPEKMHALTSLRFFAALYVVLYHTIFLVLPNLMQGQEIPASTVGRVVWLGFLSVGFFFLLSGYILGVVYLGADKPIDVKRFYIARFARIYPLFLATLLLDTPNLLLYRIQKYGLPIALEKTSVTFGANLAMLHAWHPKLKGIDDPNWSLAVETFFYLVFPFLGALIWRLRRVGVASTAACLYLSGLALAFWAGKHWPDDIAIYHPVLHLTTFLLGILLARWQVLSPQRSPQHALPLLFACIAFAVLLWKLPFISIPVLHDGLLAPIFACIVWTFSRSRGPILRALSNPFLVLLGETSFGLYLLHIPVLHYDQRLGWSHPLLHYLLYLIVCIGLSVLSFLYFEAPARKWILARFRRKSAESLEASSIAQ